jgi:hypothetical protein
MSEIKFHPLADIFPLMEGEEFDALVEDIKANGLREKIDLHQGKIVEGRNRYRALQRLGIDPSADPTKYFRKAIYAHTVGGEIASHEQSNDDRVRAYVISKNIHRRHLTVEQKRELIAKLIKAQPEKSDRQVAAVVKASPTTVGTVRAKMEATGDVSKLDTRTDKRGRRQPSKKSRGWLRERYRAHRSRKRDKPRVIVPDVTDANGNRLKITAEEISRFAYRLIQTDIELARELHRILWEDGDTHRLTCDLDAGIEIEEGGKLNDGESESVAVNDPGPIPEFLRREPGAAS